MGIYACGKKPKRMAHPCAAACPERLSANEGVERDPRAAEAERVKEKPAEGGAAFGERTAL